MTTEHLCVSCPVLRPTAESRHYDRAAVCEGCRSRLRALLDEVLEHYIALAVEPPIVPCGICKDPACRSTAHGLERGASSGDRISGSRTPPLPLRVGPLDLMLPANTHPVTDPFGDQIGEPSATSVLDSWAQDWQTYVWAHLPAPTVSSLVAWLKERVDWACDHHPAVDAFADEIHDLASRLRSAAGMTRPKAELKLGVPCRECEHVSLYRWPGSDYVECGNCPVLMTPDEYGRWTQLIASPEHQPWVRDIAQRQAGAA